MGRGARSVRSTGSPSRAALVKALNAATDEGIRLAAQVAANEAAWNEAHRALQAFDAQQLRDNAVFGTRKNLRALAAFLAAPGPYRNTKLATLTLRSGSGATLETYYPDETVGTLADEWLAGRMPKVPLSFARDLRNTSVAPERIFVLVDDAGDPVTPRVDQVGDKIRVREFVGRAPQALHGLALSEVFDMQDVDNFLCWRSVWLTSGAKERPASEVTVRELIKHIATLRYRLNLPGIGTSEVGMETYLRLKRVA